MATCRHCGEPVGGHVDGFKTCGKCAVAIAEERRNAGPIPVPAPTPRPAPVASLSEEQAAQLSLADIEAAAMLAIERRWRAYRASLRLRPFPDGLARPQPR